jgi:hypothetical protein
MHDHVRYGNTYTDGGNLRARVDVVSALVKYGDDRGKSVHNTFIESANMNKKKYFFFAKI